MRVLIHLKENATKLISKSSWSFGSANANCHARDQNEYTPQYKDHSHFWFFSYFSLLRKSHLSLSFRKRPWTIWYDLNDTIEDEKNIRSGVEIKLKQKFERPHRFILIFSWIYINSLFFSTSAIRLFIRSANSYVRL